MAAALEAELAYDASNPVAAAVWRACIEELEAPKPGNVSFASSGHGMTAADFVASARCTADVLGTPGLSLGERVLGSIEATRAATACNTNLGIVLLCAPLAQAAFDADRDRPLRAGLHRILEEATVEDTEQVFAAIRLAEPAGLGKSERHDVGRPAAAPLLEVMREAEDRDRIARQYARGFEDVFDLGIPIFHRSRRLWSAQVVPPETSMAQPEYAGFPTAAGRTSAAVQADKIPMHPGGRPSPGVLSEQTLMAGAWSSPTACQSTSTRPAGGQRGRDARAPGETLFSIVFAREMAVVVLYLEFLARFKDSHIQRKLGAGTAETIRREARTLAERLDPSRSPAENAEDLAEFDRSLKRRHINPGTSADLTVATLLAGNLLHERGDRVVARQARGATGMTTA